MVWRAVNERAYVTIGNGYLSLPVRVVRLLGFQVARWDSKRRSVYGMLTVTDERRVVLNVLPHRRAGASPIVVTSKSHVRARMTLRTNAVQVALGLPTTSAKRFRVSGVWENCIALEAFYGSINS